MGKRLYRFFSGVVRCFSHRMKTVWEVPFEPGPCVFVANRSGKIGPVNMCTKFPQHDKMHIWINHSMLDSKEMPSYVRGDYWWKRGGFAEPLQKATVPYLAAGLVSPVLRSSPHIPVYFDRRFILTLRESIRVLQREEYLLIFPEESNGWHSYKEEINTGWLRLGELWYRASGRSLKLYPVHVDEEKRLFQVAAPVRYDPSKSFAAQEKALADVLTRGLRGLT